MAIELGRRLGFGGLRLPLTDPMDQEAIDQEMLDKEIDMFLEHGFQYFDTSYIYHCGLSEVELGRSLRRHPRDSYYFSSKMPVKFMNKAEDMERIFQEQLERTGFDHFDFYLIHAIDYDTYKNCNEWGAFEFLQEKRKQGYFREFGVSLHDSPEFLDEILTAHPEIDFVVEQLNYLDWNNNILRGKDLYDIAVKHDKPIVVMEACKGGTLANVPEEAQKLMKDYNPDASIASWAYRFCASLPQVRVVLAGMPGIQFMEDNIKTMENFVPLNDEEYKIIDQVVDIISASTPIPCTACKYCVDGCPMNIPIADDFQLYNSYKQIDLSRSTSVNVVCTEALYYGNLIEDGFGRASDCIKCKKCEKVCPQHLPITQYLEEYIVAELESQIPDDKIADEAF